MDILVGVVFGGITRDHDLAFRHHRMNDHVIELTLSVMRWCASTTTWQPVILG
jgi:hypothetical protein